VQDVNGFLWLGTFAGLSRFDGYEFKTYTSSSTDSNSLPNDDITALELDEESNNLWIGTRNGLALFKMDTHEVTTFLPERNSPNSIRDTEIRSIHVDRFKRVWVGTKNEGLFVYDYGKNTFKKIELLEVNYIKEIFEDSKGYLWIGSYGAAGVAKISLDKHGVVSKIKEYTLAIPQSNKINPYVNFVYENHNSDIFVGSREGLYKLNKQTDNFDNLYIEDSATRDKLGPHFISVARAPNGKYWLGTLGGLLVLENLEDIVPRKYSWHYSELSDDDSLVDNLVSALYFDSSGVLWIGTEDGLDKYDSYENQFSFNKDISSYLDNQVPRIRGFSSTYDGKIVVATRHNGLFIEEEGSYVPLFNDEKDIASIYSGDGKTFYCGLWNGQVLVYDYLSESSQLIDIGFRESPILAYADLGNTRLLIGSHGEGAIVLNTDTLQPEKFKDVLLLKKYINQVAVDRVGNIWIAAQSGVLRYNPITKTIRSFRTLLEGGKGLSHENVSGIIIDPSGKIWAATRKGLDYYDPALDDFSPVLDHRELNGSWITDILADDEGNLWLNMNNNRVARYHTVSNELKIYYTNTGNRLDVFSSSGFYYSDDTQVYLGAKNGIISFSTEKLRDNQISPKPLISRITIQNKELDVGSVLNGQEILKEDINRGGKLILNSENKNFSLTFSSPSFINERFNKYSYILEGFDEDWNTVDVRQRTVQYTNLFFGDYIFKVRAMNSHAIWSDVSSYDVKILPPFWLTYKAGLIGLILVLCAGFFIRRQVRARIALKNRFLMEKVKRERDEKLNNEKLRFFTNISHELRTPLTLILGPAKQLLEQGVESGNRFQQNKSNLIHQNANRLLNLVNQVLDFRRAQSGELRLKVTKTDILFHTRNTFRSFEELANDKKINFNIICDNENIEGYIDRDKYDKILYNLLSNALKFTHRYGHVDLFIGLQKSNDGAQLLLEISDDGIGIPLASQEKIFSRFYQASNSKENNTGSGIGLSLVKALIELHKGKIDVRSEPEKGSIFTVKIPIGMDMYKTQEVFEYKQKREVKDSPQLITAKKIIQGAYLKERVLIVEDNAELRKYLVEYLSGYYKVFEAENGKQALEVCRKVKPILCVADIMMPKVNGLQFCSALKSDAEISHIPVVLLTALSDSDDKIRGYNCGADSYLVKPFDPSLLKTRIENIIKSRIALKGRFSGEVEIEANTLTHTPIDEQFMNRLTTLIHKNIGNNEMNTAFLCRELGMSSSKIYRKIKELTDLAPNEFIRTMRLKESAQLLKTKKYNVSEVTDLIGFSDPLYFSRCFKKQFGYPPSQLIK